MKAIEYAKLLQKLRADFGQSVERVFASEDSPGHEESYWRGHADALGELIEYFQEGDSKDMEVDV